MSTLHGIPIEYFYPDYQDYYLDNSRRVRQTIVFKYNDCIVTGCMKNYDSDYVYIGLVKYDRKNLTSPVFSFYTKEIILI